MGRQNRPTNFGSTETTSTPFDAAGPISDRPPSPGFSANSFGTENGGQPAFASIGSGSTHVVRRPTTEEIRKRAYELFRARKGRGGTPEDDWFRAERELIAKAAR